MDWKRWIFLISLGLIGAFFVRSFLFEGIYIATNSMAPTLPAGTHVFAKKWPLWFRKPRYGDIVMFPDPEEPKKGLVKRVIGVGGDVIELRKKKVIRNGKTLDEPYVEYLRKGEQLVGDTLPPIVIPEGFLFVLGDNRDYSKDSRDWENKNGQWAPYVSVSDVKGIITPP